MRLSNGQHMPGVYEVAGNQFKMLEGVLLEFRPEDSFRGVVAAVRIVPMKLSDAPHLAEEVTALKIERAANLRRVRERAQDWAKADWLVRAAEKTIETKYEREQQRLAEEVLRLRLEKQIPSGFEAAVAEAAQYLLKKAKASAAAEVAE